MNIRRTLRYLPAAAVLAFGISASAQPNPSSGQTIEGAWEVSITLPGGFPFCASAGTIATRDGLVLVESCYASDGAGYGVWPRVGNGQFATTFTGNSFGPGGVVIGKYKVRATVTLSSDGNSFSGTYRTDILDVAGNPLSQPVATTGTMSGVRIKLEPLN